MQIAACCYIRSSVVCRSVMIVSLAEMAEPIEMCFGIWTRVGSRNHVLMQRANFEGKKGPPILKYRDTLP